MGVWLTGMMQMLATSAPVRMLADVETNILPGDMSIWDLLILIVNILVYGLGVAATLGVIIAGIMYLSARDNPQQVAAAKKRLIDVAIGLLAWALLFAVVQWLIPGGVDLDNDPTDGAGGASGGSTSLIVVESETA